MLIFIISVAAIPLLIWLLVVSSSFRMAFAIFIGLVALGVTIIVVVLSNEGRQEADQKITAACERAFRQEQPDDDMPVFPSIDGLIIPNPLDPNHSVVCSGNGKWRLAATHPTIDGLMCHDQKNAHLYPQCRKYQR